MVDGDTGLPAIQLEYSGQTSFRMAVAGKRVAFAASIGQTEYSLRLVRDGFAKKWTAYFRLLIPTPGKKLGRDRWRRWDPVRWLSSVRSFARTTSTSTMTADFANFDINVADGREVYTSEMGLDVADTMLDSNASIYMRFPFTFNGDTSQLDEMDLVTRYDDGFVAYLNGDRWPPRTCRSSSIGILSLQGRLVPSTVKFRCVVSARLPDSVRCSKARTS